MSPRSNHGGDESEKSIEQKAYIRVSAIQADTQFCELGALPSGVVDAGPVSGRTQVF